MPIQPKKKPCKGNKNALGYGCGNETYHLNSHTRLCGACLYDWMLNDEIGKIYKATVWDKKVQKKTVSRKKEKEKELRKNTTNWKEKLQGKVNEIVRIIDNGQPCLARGFINYQMHAGHVYARGGNQTIRYNLHNIHRQSAQSNKWQNDDGLLREKLSEEYGNDYMEFISDLRRTPAISYKQFEYEHLYSKACKTALKLKKSITQPLNKNQRIELRNQVNIELGIYDKQYCVFSLKKE